MAKIDSTKPGILEKRFVDITGVAIADLLSTVFGQINCWYDNIRKHLDKLLVVSDVLTQCLVIEKAA